MIRRVLLLLLLLAAGGLAACSSDGTGPEDIAGVYSLRSIDGNRLPLLVFTDSTGVRVELTAEYLALASDGVVIQAQTVRLVQGNVTQSETNSRAGTWTGKGSEITLNFTSDGSIFLADKKGSTLTVDLDGSTFIYVR